MEEYQLKENQINVFKNKKKHEKQPDYWGKAKLNGVEYRVSLWVNESQQGKKYLGGWISLPELKETDQDTDQDESKDLPF